MKKNKTFEVESSKKICRETKSEFSPLNTNLENPTQQISGPRNLNFIYNLV